MFWNTYLIFNIYGVFVCMYFCVPGMCLAPERLEEEVIPTPGTEDADGCEPPCV